MAYRDKTTLANTPYIDLNEDFLDPLLNRLESLADATENQTESLDLIAASLARIATAVETLASVVHQEGFGPGDETRPVLTHSGFVATMEA